MWQNCDKIRIEAAFFMEFLTMTTGGLSAMILLAKARGIQQAPSLTLFACPLWCALFLFDLKY